MRLPGDEELIAYLDGEAGPERRREIVRLLEISPEVRARMAALRRDVEVCSRVLAGAAPSLPGEDRLWESLHARLREEPRQSEAGGFWEWLRRGSAAGRLAAAGALACAVLVAVLWLGAPPSISASDVLQRAQRAEAAHLQRVAAPVIHRRLRIVKSIRAASERVATLDSWTVSGLGLSRERLEPAAESPSVSAALVAAEALWSDLSRILESNRLDRRELLSPSGYLRWRKTAHAASERLEPRRLEDGSAAYGIATVFTGDAGDGRILRSDFVVRASDWSPVSNTLDVRTAEGDTRYDIRVVEFAVVARASLPAGYFDDAPAVPVVQAAVPAPRTLPVPLPVVAAPPEPEPVEPVPVEDEIEALYAIHRAGACDGDPVDVVAGRDGQLSIAGSVSRPDARDLIVALASIIPSARADVSVAPRLAEAESPGLASLRRMLRTASPGAATEELELSVSSFLALIASDSRALLQIVSRHPADGWAAVPPQPRAHLREMVDEHLAALGGNMRQVGAMLDGATGGAPASAPVPVVPEPAGDWCELSLVLVDDIGQVAIPEAPAANASPAAVIRELANAYRQLGARAERVRTAASAALAPDRP